MPDVHVYPDLDALGRAAAERTAERVAATDGPFALALAGGSTPEPYHRHLALTFGDRIPWARVHLFWGDERLVPLGHAESNYRMAEATLIRHVPIPPGNVHPVETTLAPEAAARAYEQELQTFFAARGGPAGFDLVVLGMGGDGHTASLFPGRPELDEARRWVAPAEAPPGAAVRERVTITFPLIEESRHALFLVAGAGKRDRLGEVLGGDRTYPAARVRAARSTEWFVDRAAYPD